MSFQDREYYRDGDDPGFREWIGRRLTVVLIGITAAVFLVQMFTNPNPRAGTENATHTSDAIDPVFDACSLKADGVANGQVWRLLTASFVYHPQYMPSLLFGMVIFYLIGTRKEEFDGGWDLVAFYLLAGTACQLGVFLLKIARVLDPEVFAFGAFGCVTALLVWFGTRFATQPVNMLVGTAPAWVAVAIVVAVVFLLRLVIHGPFFGELFAYDVVGAAFGFAYERAGLRVGDRVARLFGVAVEQRSGPARLRVLTQDDEEPEFHPFEDDGPVGGGVAQVVEQKKNLDEQLEAKLDRVLEKVSRSGRESLTADERAVLQKASEVYKRRRGS
jgi:membrane associated rhomboid family serine protease